jgi:hypothetical protein
MDKKIDNFLRAYGSGSNDTKRQLIAKLLGKIGEKDATAKAELVRLVKSLSIKSKSEDEDLAIIRKIIEEID